MMKTIKKPPSGYSGQENKDLKKRMHSSSEFSGSSWTQKATIQFVVSYWEIKPSQLNPYLKHLTCQGMSHLVSYVPWHTLESDINHTLSKFLQAAFELDLKVTLVITPEVGSHAWNLGLPRELLQKEENLAKSPEGKKIPRLMAPNAVFLPSLSSPEFIRRFHGVLARFDSLIADLGRNQPKVGSHLNVAVSGSYWKYYRSAHVAAQDCFAETCGDASSAAALAYRQKIELHYTDKEFADPNALAANRWKSRNLEDINHRWFNQLCEDQFRVKTEALLGKKSKFLQTEQIELFTPEADPSSIYGNAIQLISKNSSHFLNFSRAIDSASERLSSTQDSGLSEWGEPETHYNRSSPTIHWTSFGSFRTLTDSEKQFLLLKSLLICGSQQGSLWIDADEWLSLSSSFRSRIDLLSKNLSSEEFKAQIEILFVTPHLWSEPHAAWEELKNLRGRAQLINSLELIAGVEQAKLIWIDPKLIITLRQIKALFDGILKRDLVVVLPESPLITESAARFLAEQIKDSPVHYLNIGGKLKCSRRNVGFGQLIQIPAQFFLDEKSENTISPPWKQLANLALELANIETAGQLSDSRLQFISLERKDGNRALFVTNGTVKTVNADLIFPYEVQVSDLAFSLSPEIDLNGQSEIPAASRYSIEVPPCGVLPIKVEGVNADAKERRLARETDTLTAKNLETASYNELTGIDQGHDLEKLWNSL